MRQVFQAVGPSTPCGDSRVRHWRRLGIACSSVLFDDAWALPGSTHLSRRGLSWDCSLAAAVFDEALVDGRPADVQACRQGLLADRLGIPLNAVPIDAAELVRVINDLDARGSNRCPAAPSLRLSRRQAPSGSTCGMRTAAAPGTA